MFTTKKIAIVSVINDLVTDNRVNRTCQTFNESGYHVVLVGRKLPGSLPLPDWPFESKRMRLFFTKGPAFYAFFNLRLFFLLLFKRADILYANDLDTLLPNFLMSRLKKIPLIYDSHELFCEVPELMSTPLKRKIWLKLEGWIVPRLHACITVNQSIADIFEKKYGVKFHVVKNIAKAPENFTPKTRSELGLPEDKKIILLQGAGINIDRGAEELVEAMKSVENTLLLIIGGGDVWPLLSERISAGKLEHKVKLIGKLPKSELLHYTFNADLGLSIDKDTNLNYHYSLPNKLFDYIQAGVPVLASRLPEIERIIADYNIGDFIEDHQPTTIAAKLNTLLGSDVLKGYRQNMARAQSTLRWENEKKQLLEVIRSAR